MSGGVLWCDDVISKISSRHPPPSPAPAGGQDLLTEAMMSLGWQRDDTGLWDTSESPDSERLGARGASLRAEASLGVPASGNHTGVTSLHKAGTPAQPPFSGSAWWGPRRACRWGQGKSRWDKAETGDTITTDGPPERAVSLVMTSSHWDWAQAGVGVLTANSR